jgi:hypothetical protein
MPTLKKILVMLFIVALNDSCLATYKTGQDLEKGRIEYEKSTLGMMYDVTTYALYAGYIFGVVDAVDYKDFCIPVNTTGAQIFSIVGNYVKANPDKWNSNAYIFVSNALFYAYPCKK